MEHHTACNDTYVFFNSIDIENFLTLEIMKPCQCLHFDEFMMQYGFPYHLYFRNFYPPRNIFSNVLQGTNIQVPIFGDEIDIFQNTLSLIKSRGFNCVKVVFEWRIMKLECS
ncbi:unnamed protein product [Camellia sinensis]